MNLLLVGRRCCAALSLLVGRRCCAALSEEQAEVLATVTSGHMQDPHPSHLMGARELVEILLGILSPADYLSSEVPGIPRRHKKELKDQSTTRVKAAIFKPERRPAITPHIWAAPQHRPIIFNKPEQITHP
jgi:hypothetical protein